jgi:hypothetical protein
MCHKAIKRRSVCRMMQGDLAHVKPSVGSSGTKEFPHWFKERQR